MDDDTPIPSDLPANGSLLDGYLEEIRAAIALDTTPQTMAGYRKAGIGPEYTLVGRRVYYHRDKLKEWLANGGTRQLESAPRTARDLASALAAAMPPKKPEPPKAPYQFKKARSRPQHSSANK